MQRFSILSLLGAGALGLSYAFASPGLAPLSAKSACGCVDCRCPDCNGSVCSCDVCACGHCGCLQSARPAPAQPSAQAPGCCPVK